MIASILDATAGAAVMAGALHKHANKTRAELTTLLSKASTVDLNIHFIRMELYDQDFLLIASGAATYLLA